MAEFQEVMKHRKRMCNIYKGCVYCPMREVSRKYDRSCLIAVKDHPQQAEKIIMKWAEEHPVQTNADKFKEVFGLEISSQTCCELVCPHKDDDITCFECGCKDFWQREYKEPKGE